MKIRHMIAKASNIDGLTNLFRSVLIPVCILRIKCKSLQLCFIVNVNLCFCDLYMSGLISMFYFMLKASSISNKCIHQINLFICMAPVSGRCINFDGQNISLKPGDQWSCKRSSDILA